MLVDKINGQLFSATGVPFWLSQNMNNLYLGLLKHSQPHKNNFFPHTNVPIMMLI
jgi:hypothetical protein